MGNMSFFDNMIESKLLNLHTAFLAKVISTNGTTAKIQPLGMTKAYGEDAQKQSPLSNVPIAKTARYKLSTKTITYIDEVSATETRELTVAVPTAIKAGDVVICVCCERDITEAQKGKNSVPSLGHHSMSDSVIVGIL